MAADPGVTAERLFEGVMAPLVLGGAVRPGHAIGARVALALGEGDRTPADPGLFARVQMARVRRARRLAPVDEVGSPTGAEWALAAALHDVLQAANPTFDAALRRRAAARILDVAAATSDRVAPPANVRDALSRHTWFARALEIARTDTVVSWWLGSRTFLGVEPPSRLRAWPELRRVNVVATPHPLMELAPLAVDRARLADAVARWLRRTPLTDLATCTRPTPAFGWTEATLALVATRAGRTLATRALAPLPATEVDAALGRATRDLLVARRADGAPAVALLAERALAEAQGHVAVGTPVSTRPEVAFARGLGAAQASRTVDARRDVWTDEERRRLLERLTPAAQSAAAREAALLLEAATNAPAPAPTAEPT